LLEEGRGDPNIPNKQITDPALDALLSLVPLEQIKDSLVEKVKTDLAYAQPDSTYIPVGIPRDPCKSFFHSGGNIIPHFKSLLQNLKIPLLLHSKVQEGLASILLDLLTKNSGCPVVQNLDGRTPVPCAAANDSANGPELLELLLGHKGDPNLKDDAGWTSLHWAATNKGLVAPKIMEIILQRVTMKGR